MGWSPYSESTLHRKNSENVKEIPCQGKHREFGHFPKTQILLYTQVRNSLILKRRNIGMFALNFPILFMSVKSVSLK